MVLLVVTVAVVPVVLQVTVVLVTVVLLDTVVLVVVAQLDIIVLVTVVARAQQGSRCGHSPSNSKCVRAAKPGGAQSGYGGRR